MKRLVMIIVALVMMAMMLCGCSAPKGEQYAMTTVVVELDENNDEVICIDFNGNEWVFEGVEDWTIGDIASMVMNDCGTPIVYDDEIVSVKYGGWIDGSWCWDGQQEIIIIENN